MSAIHRLNIELEEGIDQTISFIYSNPSTNLPIDITGYTSKLVVRDDLGSPNILLQMVDSSIIQSISYITLNGTTGRVDIIFKNVTSDVFTSGTYDILLIDPTGLKIKLAKGFILINRSASL